MSVRPLVRTLAAATALLALAACEKPTPGVTVAAGTTSVHREASIYCHKGQSAEKQNCSQYGTELGVVRARQGEQVMIDVDRSIAKKGWVVVLKDRNQASNPLDETFFTLGADFSAGPVLNIEVQSLSEPTTKGRVTGVWSFQLVQE